MSESVYDRQLQAIARLEARATPSEMTYLQQQREKVEDLKISSESSVEEEQTPSATASDVDQGFHTLYWYQFERSKPDLDSFWATWVDERIEQTRRVLEPYLRELQDAGYVYTPPLYDPVKLRHESEVDRVQEHITELETTARLKLVWAERTGNVGEIQDELADLQKQLAAMKTRLVELEAS